METLPVWTLIGVIIGAIVGITAPLVTEHVHERRKKISHLKSLLSEIERNGRIFVIMKKESPHFTYLRRMSDSSFQQVKENGILADLPGPVREKLIDTYEKAFVLLTYVRNEGIPSDKGEWFMSRLEKIPSEFDSLYNMLSQHLKGK